MHRAKVRGSKKGSLNGGTAFVCQFFKSWGGRRGWVATGVDRGGGLLL